MRRDPIRGDADAAQCGMCWSMLERKLGLDRILCSKGLPSRSAPLQAKLVADVTAVPVPAVILRQVQLHLEVPHLGQSIRIQDKSSDNMLSCQISAARPKPLGTSVCKGQHLRRTDLSPGSRQRLGCHMRSPVTILTCLRVRLERPGSREKPTIQSTGSD